MTSAAPLFAPPMPKPALSGRGRVVVSRLESERPGPMRVPTVLSLARMAAHVVASSVAAACALASDGVIPAQMHNTPYTIVVYVFDNSRTVVEKNQHRRIQHPCLSREGRAFCNSRIVAAAFRPVCRDVWRNPIVAPSPRTFSMRTPSQHLLSSSIAIAAMIPAIGIAQVRPQTTLRGPGSGQPWQCNPTDSSRAFNRALRADSLARQRAAGGAVPGTQQVTGGTGRSHEFPEYDVVLDIPNLCVNRLFLKVDSVTAKLNLNARVANLVRIDAGADVLIGTVDLTIQGVRAQALLLVDLDDVVYIVDQTLTFVDNHPEIVQQLGSTLQTTVGAVGGLVNRLLLGTVTNSLGQAVQRLIDQSTGSIIEKAVVGAGQQAAERVVGNITQLTVISQVTDAAGNLVKRARDAATNAIVQYTLSKAGKLLTSSIIQAGTR